MATRKELLSSLSTLGQGLSVMQDRMKAAKSFEQEQADKEAERKYLEQYRPKTLQVQDQNIERGKLGLEDEKIKLEGSQKLKAARDAMDAQIAGEWGFVGPEDVGNVNGWRAELAILNRGSDKAISPQEFYRAKKSAMQAETRAQEAHASQLKTQEAQRGLIGANTTRAKADAERIDTAPPKPATEGQSNAALYGRRMQLAMSDLESLREKGYKPESVAAGVGRAVGKLPVVGNLLSSGESQQAKNAEINFLTAVLRRESGATIQPSEFASGEKLYFDRPGDAKETLEQKARNRSQALEGLRAAAGPAWENVAPVNRGGASGSWGGGAATDQDSEAVQWAKQNPNDPRAREILRLNGAK